MAFTAPIRCKVLLQRPASPRHADWAFFVLPMSSSARLPTRSMVTVVGSFAAQPFQATLSPDGAGSHWWKVEKPLLDAAGVAAGETVALEFAPVAEEPEPAVPADLKRALSSHPAARATWDDITPLARRDWIHWITSGKKAETRTKRLAVACDKLAAGQRRACCFDRSGMYSKGNMGPPEAA